MSNYAHDVAHEVGDCLDCSKSEQGYGARAKMYQHHKSTGHRTRVEVLKVYRYEGLS